MSSFRRALGLLILTLAAAPVVAQQKVEFYPSLSADYGYTTNLQFVGPDSTAQSALLFTANLPVVRRWRTGSLNFRYSPTAYRFENASVLDNVSHLLNLGLEKNFSRESSLRFTSGFTRTQSQGTFRAVNDPDLILTERTWRDTVNARLSFTQQPTRRFYWGTNVNGGLTRHDEIEGYTGLGGATVQDRDWYGAGASAGRTLSQYSRIGADYAYTKTVLEGGDYEQYNSLNMSWAHDVDPDNRLSLLVGVWRSQGTAAGPSGERQGFYLRFNFARDFQRVALAAFAAHRPTTGGNLPGTATNTSLGLNLAGLGRGRWRWNTGVNWVRREPAVETDPVVQAVGLTGSLQLAVHAKVGVRLTANAVRQIVDDPLVDDQTVARAALGVIWYPKGLGGGRRIG